MLCVVSSTDLSGLLLAGQRMGKLIREAEKAKIPVMCVVGNREAESGELSIRTYTDGDIGTMAVESLVTKLVQCVADRAPFEVESPVQTADVGA